MTNDNTTIDPRTGMPEFKDTPEAREAVTKVQQHYIPIVTELRQNVIDKNHEINQLQRKVGVWRALACSCFGSYLAVGLVFWFR